MEAKLILENDHVYRVHTYSLQDEPTRLTFWWRCEGNPCGVEFPVTAYGRDMGGYTVYSVRTLWGTREYVLNGSSKAERMEKTPIPQPKVRKGVEVRYKDGVWQKYSKREGWIAA